MNSPSLRYVMLKLYFPAAFLVAIILLILDAITPPVVAQVRTVTVTVFVTVTQQVYITWERTVMVTVATGIPTTLTSVVTSAVTSILTQTSVVSRVITETSVVSSLLTQTVSVAAPIRIGPLSLDLTDAGGLRFLGYTGGVALAGLVSGALAARLSFRHRKPGIIEPRAVLTPEPRATDLEKLLTSVGGSISHDGSLADELLGQPKKVLQQFGIEITERQAAAMERAGASDRLREAGKRAYFTSPSATVPKYGMN
ncbi:hypothetical protein MUP05_07595 [Candidatus Bathyarchaeota archaeon]|nr:hypothetical protein [Candidatus Bathyarchaeota archaeon]